MYALIKDGKVAKYPHTIQQFRLENTNISVPQTATESQLQELGLYVVAEVPRPVDQIGKIVTEGTPRLFNGIWTQVWVTRTSTPLEVQDQQRLLIEAVTAATQSRLDAFAMTRGYDNVNSIAKYKDISDEEIATLPASQQALVMKFRAESRYLALATASTWAMLYVILEEIKAGTRPTPSGVGVVESNLPELAWPA